MGRNKADAVLGLVRGKLTQLTSAYEASAVLLDALGRAGAPPESLDEIRTFIRGPLASALEAHDAQADAKADAKANAGATSAGRVATQLEAIVDRVEADPKALGPSFAVTIDDRYQGPPRLMVVSRDPATARGLHLAIGVERVGVIDAEDDRRVRTIVLSLPPAIVLVDAANLPESWTGTLPVSLAGCRENTILLVWGDRESPVTKDLLRSLEATGLRCMFVPREEGVAAVLDVLRARLFS